VDSAAPHRRDGRVLWPTEAWEIGGMGGYATVLQAPSGEYRYYYESSGSGKGGGSGGHACVAVSADGIRWTKPKLGIVNYNGSTDNNIFFPTKTYPEGNPKAGQLMPARWAQGNVFVDTRPVAVATGGKVISLQAFLLYMDNPG
jgi:hypothetical protein